jgi:hypothetical protein
VDLPIGSYEDSPSSSTRLLNCYIETPATQGIGPTLRGFPGISDYKVLGTEVRAAHVLHGVKYVISGNSVYKIPVGGIPTVIGTVSGSARPQIASNTAQVAFLVEPRLWVYTIATDTFAEVTDADFPGATSIQFFDNYITYTEPVTGRWGASDLAAATSYDSLLFATAEGSPDHLLTHVVDHRQAFLLGVDSCELWDNAGVSGFPFVRNPNGFVEIGCLVGATAQKADQSILWLANDYTVRRLNGVTAVRVSTHAIERKLKIYTLEGAYAQVLTWEGHIWYVLTFNEATWVFDLTTQQWFEVQSYGLNNWRVSCCVSDGGQTYVGDSQSGKFGVLSSVYDEWGDPLVASATSVPTREPHSGVEILAKMGVGLNTGQGSDPQIMLSKSDDGGQTFVDLPTRSMGAMGKRQTRARWHRVGAIRLSNFRVYRFSISDPVERHVFGFRLI